MTTVDDLPPALEAGPLAPPLPRPAGRVKALAWRPLRRNSLAGFVKVQAASGLIFNEVAVHQVGSRVWCSPPSRPWLRDGALVLDEAGKPRWQPLIEFATHGVRSSWSRQIVRALVEAFPDALPQADVPA
jgi:hypothetical protein